VYSYLGIKIKEWDNRVLPKMAMESSTLFVEVGELLGSTGLKKMNRLYNRGK
jgi:hypothetical protein